MRVTFLGPRQCRVQFRSFVYLLDTYSHILVRSGSQYNHYLRLYNSIVEVVRFHKESDEVGKMRPYNKFPLKHAAQVYLETSLPKTDEAGAILQEILSSKEDDRTNFFPESHQPVEKREKPTKAERVINKANSVTLDQVAEGLDMTPQKLRHLLRDNEYPKPGSRWQWPKSQYEKLISEFKKFRR